MQANSIPQVIARLNQIVETAIKEDSRTGYFAALYKKVTMAVYNKIQQGYFDDNARMEKLDVLFANRYLDAHEQYYSNQPCTQCWKIAFDNCRHWRPMVMHHLLTGMNAHIGLDLGIATAITAAGTAIENIQDDFNKINEVLAALVDEVKAALYSMWPLSKYISKLNMGKLENDLAGFSMNIARDAAWQSACDYALLVGEQEKENYIIARDESVANFTQQIMNPGAFVHTLTGIFRVFETGSIAGKIQKLDATLPAG